MEPRFWIRTAVGGLGSRVRGTHPSETMKGGAASVRKGPNEWASPASCDQRNRHSELSRTVDGRGIRREKITSDAAGLYRWPQFVHAIKHIDAPSAIWNRQSDGHASITASREACDRPHWSPGYAAGLISVVVALLPITPKANGIVVRPPTSARASPAALR